MPAQSWSIIHAIQPPTKPSEKRCYRTSQHTMVFHGVFVDPSSQQAELYDMIWEVFSSDLIQYPQESEMGYTIYTYPLVN